jgi:hypothetical protein
VACKKVLIALLVLSAVTRLSAQPAPTTLTFSLAPGLTIPLGADAGYLTPGGGVTLCGDVTLPFLHQLYAGLELGYSLSPLAAPSVSLDNSLSVFGGGLVLGYRFEPLPRLAVYAEGKGGYFYGLLNGGSSSGGNPYLAAGAGASYRILPTVSLGAGVSYRNFLGLSHELQLALGTSVILDFAAGTPKALPDEPSGSAKPKPLEETPTPKPPVKGSGLDLLTTSFEEIFPVFFKYYDNNPIGKVVLRNFEKTPAENVKVTFFVKQYMDNPKAAPAPEKIGPGEEITVDIYGLFTNSVLDITEGTKVSALLSLSYTQAGQAQTKELVQTIGINNRNALTWDDDRKASAFVTAKDPAVMKFAKNVSGWVKGEQTRSVNPNLLLAMAIHEALDLYGLNYVVDPTTPYTAFSQKKAAIDFLQFPKQTLEYQGGDCDDLSILTCALLESVGIETAFLTTPGHIFVAFSLETTPEEARKAFTAPDDLIFRDGKTWLPVEITVRGGGFVKAWEAGAKEWRESASKDLAGFVPMHKAWELYQPVGLPGTPTIAMPEKAQVLAAVRKEVGRFVGQQIGAQEADLQAALQNKPADQKLRNSLGILYARNGMMEKAEAEFRKVLQTKPYLPALINIGNLLYLKADLKGAQPYYAQALKAAPDNAAALLGSARVDHDLENYGTARTAYARLKKVDPVLANQFTYLDLRGEESTRAADSTKVKGVAVWAE